MVAGAEKNGFQGSHDVSGTLANQGFPRESLLVKEFCNPKMASVELKEDVIAGLMIPSPDHGLAERFQSNGHCNGCEPIGLDVSGQRYGSRRQLGREGYEADSGDRR